MLKEWKHTLETFKYILCLYSLQNVCNSKHIVTLYSINKFVLEMLFLHAKYFGFNYIYLLSKITSTKTKKFCLARMGQLYSNFSRIWKISCMILFMYFKEWILKYPLLYDTNPIARITKLSRPRFSKTFVLVKSRV